MGHPASAEQFIAGVPVSDLGKPDTGKQEHLQRSVNRTYRASQVEAEHKF